MGEVHDSLATDIGDYIISKIRSDDKIWRQVFSTSICRIGDWNWPRPDYVCEDQELGVTYALEFKPPRQNKREYLTGLGQALSYLQKHNYSGLILPKLSEDSFKISAYIKDTLVSPDFEKLPISLIEYDENNIFNVANNSIILLKAIAQSRATNIVHDHLVQKTYWCWWRDASHYEILDLLELSDKYRKMKGDIYSDYVYPEFYEMLVTGGTRQWNGLPRVKRRSDESYKSEKQNYKIPLFQLGLCNQADGRLTMKGYKLMIIGKMYGPDSKEFLDYLAYLLLTDGKHLDLINDVERFQKIYSGSIPSNRVEYFCQLDEYLTAKGAIGNRKPSAVTTGAKENYIRDEPKLWNKFGFIELKNATQYFRANEGIKINWQSISRVLLKDYKVC